MAGNPFSELELADDVLAWEAPDPGPGWCPLPFEQSGSLTEADLYLLRGVWDLAPEHGGLLVSVPPHEVAVHYAREEEMATVELPASLGPGAVPDGPGQLLVRPGRFGNLVELFSFANREEQGVCMGLYAFGALDAMGFGVERLIAQGAGPELADLALTWGALRTGGSSRAGLWLRPGLLGLEALGRHLEGVGERVLEEAGAGDESRAGRRRLLARLMG